MNIIRSVFCNLRDLLFGSCQGSGRDVPSPSGVNSIDEATSPTLSEAEQAEIEIHLAEYKGLSEFQRDAKATFVRVAMYHNTGILVATTWILQQVNAAGGSVPALLNNPYLLPLVLTLPVINAVLIVACAYQVYSFFCVARHFQLLRLRLIKLVGHDVLAYEDKFKRASVANKELSLLLDLMAGVMWFVIPLALALTVAIGAPLWIGFPNIACTVAYIVGTALTVVAVAYLIGVILLILRTHSGRVSIRVGRGV